MQVSGCNTPLTTFVSFICDSSASWDLSHNNIANYYLETTSIRDPLDKCLVSTLNLHTPGTHSA